MNLTKNLTLEEAIHSTVANRLNIDNTHETLNSKQIYKS